MSAELGPMLSYIGPKLLDIGPASGKVGRIWRFNLWRLLQRFFAEEHSTNFGVVSELPSRGLSENALATTLSCVLSVFRASVQMPVWRTRCLSHIGVFVDSSLTSSAALHFDLHRVRQHLPIRTLSLAEPIPHSEETSVHSCHCGRRDRTLRWSTKLLSCYGAYQLVYHTSGVSGCSPMA